MRPLARLLESFSPRLRLLTLVYFVGRSATPRAVDRLLRYSREGIRLVGALVCLAFVARRRAAPPTLSFSIFAGCAVGVLSSALSAEVPFLLLGGALAPRMDGVAGSDPAKLEEVAAPPEFEV